MSNHLHRYGWKGTVTADVFGPTRDVRISKPFLLRQFGSTASPSCILGRPDAELTPESLTNPIEKNLHVWRNLRGTGE
jgi:hypothetical protein